MEQVAVESDYEKVKALFLESPLSETLVGRLRKVLANIDKPLAIRSSGLFEDSLMQPFAGIFGTFLVPNSHVDPEVRLRQCLDAIRLVYASVCSPVARSYIEAINYRLEEERMAVIIHIGLNPMRLQQNPPQVSCEQTDNNCNSVQRH